ncbi:MAG: hypothetical protein JSW61_07555 [Candidatus Thorarchaeota archaeon]|nr:MAG: hypothetical protein JSW61_07555 [Candidatus Thorarchaeota archaeon]
MGYREEGSFFYYLALLIGMTLVGAYFWYILDTPLTNTVSHLMLFLSGVLLVVSTMGLGYANTRSGRIGLTAMSGIFAGVHGYLDITVFPLLTGIILFAWIAFGLMLAFAAFAWLKE